MVKSSEVESLAPIFVFIRAFFRVFKDSYGLRKQEKAFIGELPLTTRGWRMNIVEAKHLYAIPSFLPHIVAGNEHRRGFSQSIYPQLADMDDVDEITKVLQLGEVIDSRFFPVQHGDSEFSGYENLYDSLSHNDAMWEELIGNHMRFGYHEFLTRTTDVAKEWAYQLADEHMARTHPDFEQAQQRMASAYSKLFELEQSLRLLIQQRLEAQYTSSWWEEVPDDIKNRVLGRENHPPNRWFDDYVPSSRLRFADFGDLQRIVLTKWDIFRDDFGDKELFRSNMIYLTYARHRIAHINTLGADDYQEFLTQSERMLRLVRPYIQL